MIVSVSVICGLYIGVHVLHEVLSCLCKQHRLAGSSSGVAVSPQIGFGAYPVVIKKFAQQNSANPIIFSFYRLTHHCCLPNFDAL